MCFSHLRRVDWPEHGIITRREYGSEWNFTLESIYWLPFIIKWQRCKYFPKMNTLRVLLISTFSLISLKMLSDVWGGLGKLAADPCARILAKRLNIGSLLHNTNTISSLCNQILAVCDSLVTVQSFNASECYSFPKLCKEYITVFFPGNNTYKHLVWLIRIPVRLTSIRSAFDWERLIPLVWFNCSENLVRSKCRRSTKTVLWSAFELHTA